MALRSGEHDGRRLVILLVEDEPGDAFLTTEAVRAASPSAQVEVVEDGVEAMDYLRRGDAPRPTLIFLDLNLPRKDGRQVLAEIKSDPALRAIPVVVMTTSSAQTDIAHAYDLHANAYVTKPVDLSSFMEVVRDTCEFWLATARTPAAEGDL